MSILRNAVVLAASTVLVGCAQDNAVTAPLETGPAFAIDEAAVCNDATMPAVQCEALVALYESTNGESWLLGNWSTEPDPCAWSGVTCNPDGTVKRIWLFQYGLSGTIPSGIADLADLEDLRLWGNQIGGAIPASIGNLTDLEILILANNDITGSIPDELANLTSMTILSLGSNELTGPVPAWLANISTLEDLRLNGNDLSGPIPAGLAALPAIREVDLAVNDLTGEIPVAFGSSTTLELLLLYSNQLTGTIPPELGNMSQLRSLALHDNQLTGTIPEELANLTSLNVLYLHENQLTGLVPLAFAELSGAIQFCAIGPPPGNEGLYMPDVQAYRDADIDGDGEICNLPLATDEDIGEDVEDALEDLVPDPLTEGNATALQAKIDNAIEKAANGQYGAAINQMNAFLNQLANMVADGTLTADQAAPFIEQAEFLIAIWTAML